MPKTARFVCLRFATAILVVFAASLYFAGAAHAHGEPVIDNHVSSGSADLDAEGVDDWVSGHCHGAPSCTGAVFLTDITRPVAVFRLGRNKYFVARSHFKGRLPTRDPPIPIALL